ncbi:MAG: hypothetical protein JNG86_10360 [Verrucomicrobiaceae bacterium]|nr:hypothetical protein [Verrucomicrobiaceae bacterium]
MHFKPALFTLAALASLMTASPLRADGDWSVAKAEMPKMAVFAEDVTVDGERRPDLGRALADSISTALLRRGQVRVFNLMTEETATGTQMLVSPRQSGVNRSHATALDKDIDYLLSFNLFSNGPEHRMTVKKTRVASSELIDSWQFNHFGRASELFGIVPKIVDRVDPKPQAPVFPISQSPAELRPWVRQENHPFFNGDYANPASPTYDPWRVNNEGLPVAQLNLKDVPKALVYRELGSIQHINDYWKFAIVRPNKGVKLREHDPLHVLYDEGDVYANLRVGTVESAGAVADYGGLTPDYKPLFKGDKVFGWAPPMALPEDKRLNGTK